jgi:hypothetical protein
MRAKGSLLPGPAAPCTDVWRTVGAHPLAGSRPVCNRCACLIRDEWQEKTAIASGFASAAATGGSRTYLPVDRDFRPRPERSTE